MQKLHLSLLTPALVLAGVIIFFLSFGVIKDEVNHFTPPPEADLKTLPELPEKALPVSEREFFKISTGELNKSDLEILNKAAPILPPKDVKLHVNLAEQRLCLGVYGNDCAKAYPTSTGAYDTPTPTGEHQIYFKQPLRISGLDQPYRMPYYMAFAENGGYGLHALPYLGSSTSGSAFWHEARWHIGLPVSHGCIRLLPEHAEEIYNMIEAGTPLIIE